MLTLAAATLTLALSISIPAQSRRRLVPIRQLAAQPRAFAFLLIDSMPTPRHPTPQLERRGLLVTPMITTAFRRPNFNPAIPKSIRDRPPYTSTARGPKALRKLTPPSVCPCICRLPLVLSSKLSWTQMTDLSPLRRMCPRNKRPSQLLVTGTHVLMLTLYPTQRLRRLHSKRWLMVFTRRDG